MSPFEAKLQSFLGGNLFHASSEVFPVQKTLTLLLYRMLEDLNNNYTTKGEGKSYYTIYLQTKRFRDMG